MKVSPVAAVLVGGRVTAVGRVKAVERGSPSDQLESLDSEIVDAVVLRGPRRRKPSPDKMIRAGGTPASRSSAAVLDQLTRLTLGGE